MELTSAFHSTNLFLFSRHHILTNGVARSDEGLTLETSAFLSFTVANLRFQPSC